MFCFLKYLGACTDENLQWTFDITEINRKLVKAKAMFSKVKHHVNERTLRSIYLEVFIHTCHMSALFEVKVLTKIIN